MENLIHKLEQRQKAIYKKIVNLEMYELQFSLNLTFSYYKPKYTELELIQLLLNLLQKDITIVDGTYFVNKYRRGDNQCIYILSISKD